MSNELSPGFANPVADAQSCFRAVLDAMARPGQVQSVMGVSAPGLLCNAAAAVLLTLADQETPLWLDPAAKSVREWIVFHTGASIVANNAAVFALALSLPELEDFSEGSDEMPESSVTIILQMASLRGGQKLILAGPGLREPKMLAVDGLPIDFCVRWARNHALYPRGIDLILCAGNELTALPRSISVREA